MFIELIKNAMLLQGNRAMSHYTVCCFMMHAVTYGLV